MKRRLATGRLFRVLYFVKKALGRGFEIHWESPNFESMWGKTRLGDRTENGIINYVGSSKARKVSHLNLLGMGDGVK